MALLTVNTEGGVVEGLPAGNQAVSLFKGIPFAAPPVGDLRWRGPQPAAKWEGVLKAYKFAPTAIQGPSNPESYHAKDFFVITHPMSEDCLYLNVWTPAKSKYEKLPVGVYIHGGGYIAGYSYMQVYDGEAFAKRGIVIVTIAYRVNAFGFLAHPELTAESGVGSSGNYGLQDQIFALQWVKRNISEFGGDPEKITIFGQSGGGGSVQNLCATPFARGLFKRAIQQSAGGMWQPDSVRGRDISVAENLGVEFFEAMGVKTAAEARALDAQKILDTMLAFMRTKRGIWTTPTIDGYYLPQQQYLIFRSGNFEELDYMVGGTANEDGGMGFPPNAPPVDVIKSKAGFYGEYAQRYIDLVKPEQTERYQTEIYKTAMRDETLAGNLAWGELQCELGRNPSYVYYFTYVPPGAEQIGAHHSVEHHYVFQTLMRSVRPYTGFDYDLSDRLCNYWANFIKTGNPNGEGLPEWKPFTKDAPEVMEIGREQRMTKIDEKPNVTFMKNFLLGHLD